MIVIGEIPGLSPDDLVDVMSVVDSDETSIRALIEAGKLDPKKHFQHCNFCGMPLAGEDVRGIDFTGSDLRNTGIEHAVIDETTILTDAILDVEPSFLTSKSSATSESDASETESVTEISQQPPRHVAILMDGNGRWAHERGLPRTEGYRRGVEALRRTVRAATDLDIQVLSVLAFGETDWSRSPSEVREIMGLLRRFVRNDLIDLHQRGVRIRFVGEREDLDPEIRRLLEDAEGITADNQRFTLVIAFNYSSRREIVRAARRVAAARGPTDYLGAAFTVESITKHLDAPDLPFPEIVIRTSGEQSLADFMVWQAANSELIFVPTYWPDFDRSALESVIAEYQRRIGRA